MTVSATAITSAAIKLGSWAQQPDLTSNLVGHKEVLAIREQARLAFLASGLPTRKHERYRYLSLGPLSNREYCLDRPVASDLHSALVQDSPADALSIIIRDGQLCLDLSDLAELPKGIRVTDLAHLSPDQERLYATQLARTQYEDKPFLQMNLALMNAGVLIEVDDGVVCSRPLHITYVATGESAGCMQHAHNLIVVGKRAKLSIIEEYTQLVENDFFHSVYTQFIVDAEAAIQCVKLQHESVASSHFASSQFYLQEQVSVDARAFCLGSGSGREELDVFYAGSHASFNYNALMCGRQQQQYACYTTMHHRACHGRSQQMIRALADQKSQLTVDGGIVVAPKCTGTVAHFQNRNLLLSPTARVNTKPALLIDNDDVMCSHGATIGRLDDQALFYLRSRGIAELAAKKLLMSAFIRSLYRDLPDSLVVEFIERSLFDCGLLHEGGGYD